MIFAFIIIITDVFRFDRRRHSMANCGSMVRDSALVTWRAYSHNRSFEWYDR